MQKIIEKISNPLIFVIAAAFLRLLPHVPNFAPIGAMALFGGAYLSRRYAIALPLSALFLSDIFIGFDGIDGRAAIYGSFILISCIGMWLKSHKTILNVIGATLASSVLFFLITNFTVLYTESLYPKTFAGLVESYTMALPFFRNTIAGDFFYTAVFFGSFELITALSQGKQLAWLKIGVKDG